MYGHALRRDSLRDGPHLFVQSHSVYVCAAQHCLNFLPDPMDGSLRPIFGRVRRKVVALPYSFDSSNR